MQTESEINPTTPSPVQPGIGVNEVLLRSEIRFWRELIDTCDPEQPPDTIERMRHALALAERRLNLLFEAVRESGAKRPENVYYLERGRGSTD